MATGGANLEDLVEEHLSCKICFEQYTDPKILDCIHTFCRPCIEKYVQKNHPGKPSFPCPTCRREIKIPLEGFHDLKSNFYITGIKSDYDKIKANQQKPSKSNPLCDPCKQDGEDVISEKRCLECEDFLCQPCATAHRRNKASRDHKIFAIEEMHSEKYQKEMRALQFTYCKRHEKEPLELYCTTCKMCICVKCKVLAHEKHVSVPTEVVTIETKQILYNLLEELRKKREDFRNAVDLLKSDEKRNAYNNGEAKKDINRRIRLLCHMIEECGKRMCNDVETVSQQNTKQLDAMQNSQSLECGSMSSVITFLQPLLEQGKPAEIMDMSEQCITRINELLKSNLESPPVLDMPFLQTISWTETAIQQVMGAVVNKKYNVEKIMEFSVELDKGDPVETVIHMSTTPDGDIVVGTWCDDVKKRHIHVYSRDGVKKNTFPVPGLKGLVVIPDGRIAVTVWPDKVCLYTLDGKVSHSLKCTEPVTISVDSQGHLVVLTGDQVVHVFNPDGKQIRRFDEQKSKAEYKYVKFIAVNHAHKDDIIVSDTNDHCLYVYNSSGELQFTYGSKGNGDGHLDTPNGVCCNSDGDILVADFSNHRIHLVSSTGQFKYFLLTKEEDIKLPKAVTHLPDGCLVVGEQEGAIKIYKYK